MTTKLKGGKISCPVALTLEAQAALEVGNPVMVTGNYECDLADGTAPVVGYVSVANKVRSGGAYPTDNVPGDVTVEAIGFGVKDFPSSGALAAGIAVGINATQQLAAVGAGVAKIGILLQPATAAGQDVDVLLQS